MNVVRDIPGLDPIINFHIFGYPIAGSTMTIFIIVALFAVLGCIVTKKFKIRPSMFQTSIEMIYEGVFELVSNITDNRKRTEIIFPVVGAMMIYLILANVIDLIPGFSQIEVNGKEVFSSATADFNTTLGLALGAVLVINLISIKEWGLFAYLGKFFKFKEVYLGFKKSISEGFVALIEFFVGLLDVIGEITKVISLSLRLFGNMYAGKVLTIILLGIFAYIVPATWLAMNLFVGILQAVVFASLVAAYYTLAINPEKDRVKED